MKKKVFLSFLMPYPIRSIEAPYLWVFYKQLSSFKSDEVVFIGAKEYKKNPSLFKNRFEINQENAVFNDYKIPTIEEINKYSFYEFPAEIFFDLNIKNLFNTNRVFFDLLTKKILEVEIYLETLLVEISKNYDILGILSWCNFPSLNKISTKYNIPIIYNELGALRKPHYLPTAYFDFTGVNGNTESKSRFFSFKNNYDEENIYSLKNIQDIILNVNFKFDEISEIFDIGIALQVEDDSNILAYSNGFDSISLIRWVNDIYMNQTILLREHPASHLSYEKFGNIDFSANSYGFISKCNLIVTINSSVALEALLLNKDVKLLGDSPFSFINELANSEKLLALNFVIFGYMIPFELLFNYDYYLWRLSKPSEKEIFNKHLNFYIGKIENRIKKEIRIKDSYSNFIQLFIAQGDGILEENSIKLPVSQNEAFQEFTFDLTDKPNIKTLRLDPLNECCVIEIESLHVKKNTEAIDLLPYVHSNAEIHHGKSYFFTTDDSQIYLTGLDESTFENAQSLVVVLRYAHIAKDALHVSVKQKNQELEHKEQNIQSLNQELEHKEQNIQSLNQELEHKEQNINALNQELVDVYTSKSWKITRTLRHFKRIIKGQS